MPSHSTPPQIDSAYVAAIAREVIRRLKEGLSSQTQQHAASLSDRVITVDTVQRVGAGIDQLLVGPDAIITPAAKDEARQLGMTITRTVELAANEQPSIQKFEITDRKQPKRADTIRNQLKLRGIESGSGSIVLSDQPAQEVFRRCQADQRAVMVASAGDVHRFAVEWNPNVWVFDMQRMNLPVAVNAAAQIARLGTSE